MQGLWSRRHLDPPQGLDLTLDQADALFRWQLVQTHPTQLNELSIFMASVIENKQCSRRAFHALRQCAVISSETGEPDTSRIDRNFSHHLACVSRGAQRRIVSLLFHWEEELTRWKLLDAEAEEIRQAMMIVGDDDLDFNLALRAVELKRKMLPSLRGKELDDNSLPAYR